MTGADATDLRDAEISLEQALLDLEEAYANLAAAQVTAPIAGTVLSISAEVGERLAEGAAVMTLADTAQLELTIEVAEVDVVQVVEGQAVAVEIDALSGQSFAGEVEYIAPASEASAGVVNYPVTIRLIDDALVSVRPGMTAVATIENTTAAAADSWFIPTSAITVDGDSAFITVSRGETQQVIPVTAGVAQGEWTAVQSADLQSGDQVAGILTSSADESAEDDGFGPPNGAPPSPFRR